MLKVDGLLALVALVVKIQATQSTTPDQEAAWLNPQFPPDRQQPDSGVGQAPTLSPPAVTPNPHPDGHRSEHSGGAQ